MLHRETVGERRNFRFSTQREDNCRRVVLSLLRAAPSDLEQRFGAKRGKRRVYRNDLK